jgi:hypothetical protein
MSLLSPRRAASDPRSADSVDPRTLPGAYLAAGANLYRVMGVDDIGRIVLEDCLTLRTAPVQAALLDEARLVLPDPLAPYPER